ncbi:MAG: hypothetical protein ACRDTP_04980 [Mycobacteriales bacterium]
MSQLFAPAAAWFATTSRGWAVGTVPCHGGTTLCVTMVRTSDGGASWTSVPPPPFLDLTDPYHQAVLRMTAGGDGLLTDGRPGDPLWSTHDAGATWTKATLTGAAPDAEVGAIALEGKTAYVVAGGRTGRRVYTGPVDGATLRATGPALVGTDGAVDLTTAGTRAWVLSSPGLPGQAPTLWRTDDTSTWTPVPTPCLAGATGRIAATSSTHVVLGCQDEPRGPNAEKGFFTSSDGGQTFTPGAHLAPDGYLQSIAAPSTSVVVAAASSDNDLLVRSGDGAKTFVVSFASQVGGEGQGFYDLDFPDSTHGYVVLGDSGAYAVAVAAGGQGVPPPRLLTTSDAGGHWTQLSIGR